MKIKLLFTLLFSLVVVVSHEDAFGRGFGGGGGRGGGGGGARAGGGGGTRPSVSRPSGGGSRPNLGGSRPNMGASRPNMGGGAGRPNIGGGGRPNIAAGNRPNIGGGNRPNFGGGNPISGGANRPNIGGGNRPSFGDGNRPGIGNGNRPGIGNGPPSFAGGGNRPGLGEGNRPGIGNGNRPGPDNGLPGLAGGNRPGIGDGGRPGIGNRPGAGGSGERNPFLDRPGNRPGGGGSGERNPFINNRPGGGNNIHIGDNNFNFQNNHNNFAVGNGNWNNNWHHGYWGGGNWSGAAAGWGLGYASGYRHGYWNGYANSSWYRPWYGTAAAWGLGAWALGSVYYDSGYAAYSNPYYVSSPSYYDYSQPIQVVTQPAQVVVTQDSASVATPPQPPPQVQASLTHLDTARDAFMVGDYAKAGTEVDLAIKDHPTDAALHEFRALVYFAVADYSKAAATLYAVLSAGPGWDWTTMSSLYPSVDTYTTQLRALEQYARQKPDAADARFVLAYHYITATHTDAAIKQLQAVARLQPSDQLTVQLIKGLGGEVPSKPGTTPPPATDPQVAEEEPAPPPDIDPAKIVGHWTAKRTDGTTFKLDLTDDQKFTWAFERAGKKQSFGGTYTVDGAVLVLERDDKATMPGMVTMEGKGFNFTLFGAPEEDPGLDFKS